MAYVSKGSYNSTIETKWKKSGYENTKQEDFTTITLDDGYAMYFKQIRDSSYGGNVSNYEFVEFKISFISFSSSFIIESLPIFFC